MGVPATRRRQCMATGAGLVAAGAMGVPVAAQDGETEDDETGRGEATDDNAFDAFANDLEAALADAGATVVSHSECPRFSELVVTTQGADTGDGTFHEELGIVAGEYARFVDDTDAPPAFGVLVYVYETTDAATESIIDPFARYTVPTAWAEDVLETEDSEAYLGQILRTVEPPVAEGGDESGGDTSEGSADDDAQIEITDHELVRDDSGFTTETYVAATVENAGDGPSGEITLDASWYSEGDYLDSDSAYLQTLGAGETWLARVTYLGTSGEDVDDYELEHEVDPDPPSKSDGLELVESDMRVGEDEVVVEGRVENATGAEQSYIQATVKFYNSEGAVIGDEWTNVIDVPEGETWAFEITWFEPGRVDEVADYEIVISNRL